MDVQGLSAFLEVADSGSFSRAGERLHLSQPAISKRIAALEDALGTRLFDRIGRNIQLTDAGLRLLPHARRVLAEVEDGRRALSQLAGTVSGRLSIGTSHHIGLHRLPDVLRRYTQAYPDVDLDIQFMDSEDACEAVAQGRLELGIVTLPDEAPEALCRALIWPDPLALVCGREHPLRIAAGPDAMTLGLLAEHPAVLPDSRTYTHRIVMRALEAQGLSPRVRLATNYLETLKMLVGIGLGWSVLPRSMIDDTIVALPTPIPGLHRELGAVWHRGRTRSGPARALLTLLGVNAVAAAP